MTEAGWDQVATLGYFSVLAKSTKLYSCLVIYDRKAFHELCVLYPQLTLTTVNFNHN